MAQIKRSECFSTPTSYANKYALFELKSHHCPRGVEVYLIVKTRVKSIVRMKRSTGVAFVGISRYMPTL